MAKRKPLKDRKPRVGSKDWGKVFQAKRKATGTKKRKAK